MAGKIPHIGRKSAIVATLLRCARQRQTIFYGELGREVDVIGPFSVVDGQHRLEGLKMAAQKDDRVLDFEVPVNIAINLPTIAQMCHFLIVNTTQKSVDKSVEQQIIARLTNALDVEEDLPSLPKWILRTVQKGEVEKAIRYASYLNETEDSPWFEKIRSQL
jgi:hypothetical protein